MIDDFCQCRLDSRGSCALDRAGAVDGGDSFAVDRLGGLGEAIPGAMLSASTIAPSATPNRARRRGMLRWSGCGSLEPSIAWAPCIDRLDCD